METRNRIQFIIFIFAITFWLSCSTLSQKNTSGSQPETGGTSTESPVGPPEPFGPPTPSGDSLPEVFGPDPVQLRPVVLVLGPGIARGFAHAGVLKALSEAKIPIGAIVATEMGALVGILFGMNETINDFEWSLQKLKEELFIKKKGFLPSLFGNPTDGKALEKVLRTTLKQKVIEKGKFPIHVVFLEENGALFMTHIGEAVRLARASVAIPGIMTPSEFDKRKIYPASTQRPFPLSEAKALGLGPVIVVDVMGPTAPPAPRPEEKEIYAYIERAIQNGVHEIQEADLVLRPDLNQIGYLDFQKKTEAIFIGKSAVTAQLNQIRRLVGMPEISVEGGSP